MWYAHDKFIDPQGRVKFLTGGKVRERKLNRCDSGTDSKVWMEEDDKISLSFSAP